MSQRIKGQETKFLVLLDGEPGPQFTSVMDATLTDEIEVLSQGYLGETTERKDNIYNGTSISGTAHIRNTSEIEFRQLVIDDAQRISAVRIDISWTMLLPTGATRTFTLLDCKFGNLEFSAGGRGEYVSMSFEASCSNTQIING